MLNFCPIRYVQYDQCSVANSEAGDNSLRKKLLAFWTPYILSHTPGAVPICEKKNWEIFSEKSMSEK